MTSEIQIVSSSNRRAHWLSACSAAVSVLLASQAFALGLGEVRVRSNLGQPLLAHTDLIGSDVAGLSSSCLRARVNSIDGQFLANANITIYTQQDKRALSISTRQIINEPAVVLVVDVNCEVQLHREFAILLDPPDASQTNQAGARDESPFAGRPVDGPKSVKQDSETQGAAQKRNKRRDPSLQTLSSMKPQDLAPTVQKSSKKSQKAATKVASKAARDVLKLSDKVILPEMPSLPQGLRMSDVLSSEAGRELVQNTEELRAAQARMAAILRDEPVASVAASNQNDLAAIANLKRETEALRRQSAVDKAALEALQNKSQFDFWLTLLAGVAVVAVSVIGFLLYYIRAHVKRDNATWWEDNPDLARLDAESDSLIPDFKVEQSQQFSTSKTKNSKQDDLGNDAVAQQDPKASNQAQLETESGFHRTPTLEETSSSIFNFFSPRGTSVKVEEISDVTQEAEFWISMNDPLRAIEILEPQERIEDPDSPVPWLFLLDLYRTTENPQKYNQLRDRFIVHFNANIPEYEADLASLPHRHLEDFPHLLSRICALWNTSEIIPYLESLLVDDREGKRTGFDLPVYRDILMLLGIAHELERYRAIEAELQPEQKAPTAEAKATADPLQGAEFNMIEFETIDFPAIDLEEVRRKK